MRAIFIMIKTEPGHTTEVANRVGDIESFSEGYSITGQYDLLVKLYVEDIDRLDSLVAELKRRGHSKANKSQVIRAALEQIDLDRVPRSH